jgi:hypothetical protein
MGVSRFVVRWSALALAALTLGACATQRSDEVMVGIGSQPFEQAKARDYAALYTPYAMMATAAYTDKFGLDSNHCPDWKLLAYAPKDGSADDPEFRSTVRDWIKDLNGRGWFCHSGVFGSLECPTRLPGCQPVGGLEYHIWRRMKGLACLEVAIAFRGSDKNDRGDWISNFRWLYRLAPKFDQYAQVQTHIRHIVEQIKQGCGGGNDTQFVSTGHSLGGGLAQQAAYADHSIRYVYGFDPSPVTGFFDVSAMLRERTTQGLGVDRAYEYGEILMLPRLLVENIFPPSPCHPRIRTVRFNMLDGLPLTQHKIADLTQHLRVTGRGADPKRVAGYVPARTCDDVPMMMAPPA